jgi:hypothetical protein
MSDKYITIPRPIFEPDNKKPADKQILYAGTKTSGIVIKITKQGLEIEGYYKGMSEKSPIYANLKEPVEIDWESIDKAKDQLATAKKRKKINKNKPDEVEKEIDDEYLKTLPIVTINSNRYYIDGTRRERRPVNNPKQVWKY